MVHGKLGAVRVVTLPHGSGLEDVRIALLVLPGKAVGGAFRRGGFQVVQVARFLLVLLHAQADELQDFLRKGPAFPGGDVHRIIGEVAQQLVHAVDPDGGEMVAEGGQVAPGVRVQAAVIHLLDEGPFLFQA